MREYINHYGAIRLRLTGVGNLKSSWYSQDDVKSVTNKAIPILASDSREPTRLTNFNSQRAILKLYTTDMGEFFSINRIVIYTKTVGTAYPQ